MPGACAYGTFANNAITSVPIAAAMIVAKNTACVGIPVADKILGLTKMM